MTPRIVERFPKYRQRVLAILPRDRLLAELSEDYDRVVGALELECGSYEQRNMKQEKTYRELLRLKRELEYELLERLAVADDSVRWRSLTPR